MSGIDPTGAPLANAPAPDAPPADRERLRKAAEAFEGLLVQLLVREMSKAQLEKGFFGDGPGSSVYESMFQQHLSERLAEESPLGIAEMLLERWTGDLSGAAEAERALGEIRRNQARQEYGPAQVPAAATDSYE